MLTGIDQPVLVLNRLWQAVNVCSARRAFSLLCSGQAQVVDPTDEQYQTFNFEEWNYFSQEDLKEEDTFVHTVNFRIRVPKIIVLMIYDRLPIKEVKLTRKNIFERDQYICQYCGRRFDPKDLNLDHVVPRDRGGKTSWENVVTSCIRCNTKKANRLLQENGMRLLKKPQRPKQRVFLNVHLSRVPHPSWRHFLDVGYWNVELSD